MGSGSGYLTAAMCAVARQGQWGGERGEGTAPHVVGIEHIEELVDAARANLAKDPHTQQMLTSGACGRWDCGCPGGMGQYMHTARTRLHRGVGVDAVHMAGNPGALALATPPYACRRPD